MVTGKAHKLLIRPHPAGSYSWPSHDTTMSVDHEDLERLAEPTVDGIAVGR
ncbi:MAG: hypothetical protein ACRDO9_11990 [Gaiellales bacterium]